MDFHCLPCVKAVFLFSLLIFGISVLSQNATAAVTNEQIESLDLRFHQVSSQTYQYLCQQKKIAAEKFPSMQQLDTRVKQLADSDQHINAICLIKNNLDTIKDNIEDQAVFHFLSLLLKHNELKTAENLFTLIQQEGDRVLVSNASFIFARYYLHHKEWQKILKYLEGIASDLPAEDANYALLIQGFALQGIKKHRKAVDIYLQIAKTSKYYPAAMLNTSVAYIRQGWWTDAHMTINKLLGNAKIEKSEEFINRLYLVLGYSLLKEGFFREAREAFRNVSLKSKYTNRALLGIALTATNQEDFIGALNAITILKGKNSQDLSVDESYLLLPYIYEKLMQYMTATASYTEAMKYYKKRIQDIQATMNSNMQFNALSNFIHNNNELLIHNTIIDFSRHYPESFLQNYAELEKIRQYTKIHNVKENRVTRSLNRLHSDYAQLLTRMVRDLLDTRTKYLNSYMNQARYGLARLYDNTAQTEN